jgi:hypothetical protein
MHYGDQTAMSVMDIRTGVAAPVGHDAALLHCDEPVSQVQMRKGEQCASRVISFDWSLMPR